MNSMSIMADELREQIIARPDVILDDRELMRALIAANEQALGANIVDLRGIAMERLEDRLDRLEDTHRSVIAAAYENLAGTNLVHRAVLRMLEATDFETFLADLDGDVAEILRVDRVQLILEAEGRADDTILRRVGDVLRIVSPGFVEEYFAHGRKTPTRRVILRKIEFADPLVYGQDGDWIRSEACVRLDLGGDRLPGMLAFGAEDPVQFTPVQGTDLVAFFAAVFERTLRRWLA